MRAEKSKLRKQERLEALDTAATIAAFSECTKKFTPELVQKYADQWVAIYRAKVAASDGSLDGLIKKLTVKKIPPYQTAVRFMSREVQTLVLARQCSRDTSTTSILDRISTAY